MKKLMLALILLGANVADAKPIRAATAYNLVRAKIAMHPDIPKRVRAGEFDIELRDSTRRGAKSIIASMTRGLTTYRVRGEIDLEGAKTGLKRVRLDSLKTYSLGAFRRHDVTPLSP